MKIKKHNAATNQTREKAYSRTLHRLRLPMYCCWLGALACAIWTSVVGWLAAVDLGSAIPLIYALAMWGATFGWIIAETIHEWQAHVARTLYYEDIADGVCPDRGAAITPENGWKWYKQQGSPWRVNHKRPRPKVHPSEALARLMGEDPAPRYRQERR